MVYNSLVVSIGRHSGAASPTGIVHNTTAEFAVQPGSHEAASVFIFAGEASTLSGWSPGVNPTSAIKAFERRRRRLGLQGPALASDNSAIPVCDRFSQPRGSTSSTQTFTEWTWRRLHRPDAAGGLRHLHPGDQRESSSFAKQDAAAARRWRRTRIVDVFDPRAFVKRLVDGVALNAPWGIAQAPADFGPFSNALLVGNVGDGKINASTRATGAKLGYAKRRRRRADRDRWSVGHRLRQRRQQSAHEYPVLRRGPFGETRWCLWTLDFH
jgi:hypothetical protein